MNEHPMVSGSSESWYDSPVEPGYSRVDLGQQIQQAMKPDRYVHGDALYGWSISDEKPAFGDLSWGGQLLLRARLNDYENPRGLFGDNQAYIDQAGNLIENAQGKQGTHYDPMNALTNMIPFASSRRDELAPILEAVDPDWNGVVAWNEWKKENPQVAEYLTTARGIVPEDAFSGTRNRDAFMFIINMEMTKAQIQQEIDEYEKNAGTYERWTQFIGGGAIRQLVIDSDAMKTVGLAGIGKGIGGAAKGVSWGLTSAKVLAPTGRLSGALNIVSKAGEASAIHNVLAKNMRLGTAGALAIEGAATGAIWDAQHQSAMIDNAKWLGQADLEYDFSDTFKAGALGAVFGLSMYGAVKAVGGLANRTPTRKSVGAREALRAAGLDDSPLTKHGLTPEGLTLQRLEEDAFVKINRTLGQVSDERLGFLLSKDVVEAAGRTVDDAGRFVDSLMNLRKRGVRLSDDAMVELVDDFLNQGTLQKTTATERAAIEKALAREELLAVKQANPLWRAHQERQFDAWRNAIDRLDALPDGDLTVETLTRALEGTGVRPTRGWTKAEALTYAQNQTVFIDNLLNQPANPVSAAAAAAPSLSLEDALGITGYTPRSAAGKIVQDLRVQLTLIDEQKALGGKGSGNAIKTAKAEVKRLTTSLSDLYGKPIRTPRAKADKVKVPSARALDAMSPADQTDALNRIFDGIRSSPNEVLEAHTLMGKALKYAGYEGSLKRFLLNRTGIYSTARSKLQAIREAVMLFGSPDFNSRAFAGRGGAGVGVISALGRAERDAAPLKSWLEAFANRRGMSDDLFAEFNQTVESAMNRKARMPAGHAFEREGNEFISMYQKYVDDTIGRGRKTRALRPSKESKVSTFLPLIVNDPYLRANYNEAVDDLMAVWHKQAQESEFLNPEYLESLGWVNRPVDRFGNRAGKMTYSGPLEKFEGKRFPKREDLTPEALAQYEAALANAETLRGPAQLYWSRFLGQEVRGGDVRSINDKVYGANGRNPHKRKITQLMLENNPQLKRYFNRDLFTMIDRYAKTAGFKAHIGESIQRAYGVNATLSQVMNALEARMATEFKGDPDILREITESFDKAHEMVSWLGGYLPDLDPSYSAWGKYSADFLGKTGFLLTAGGIGASNAFEAFTKMFFMAHSPADFGRNVKSLIRGLFANRAVLREELAGLAHDSRRMAVGYSHQLFAGRVDHTYELTTRGMLGRPWRDAWDTALGRIEPGNNVGRVASTALATMDAVGKTAYMAGAAPRITHATQVMVNGAAQREFMRFSDAVIKLRDLMAANPLDPTDVNASTKAFKDLARKAGFGDRWDLAEKFIRWDLPEVAETLQKAAAQVKVKNRIHARHSDMFDVYARMPEGPEKAALYEGLQRYGQYLDDRISEELAEASAWSARTDSRSRTHWGRALDMFTNYMHNMYFHRLAKASSMPSRVFMGVVSGLVVTELLTSLLQDYLNGTSVDDMLKQWDSPEEALTSTLSRSMRIPVFGALSFVPKYIGDSAIDTVNAQMGNESVNPYAPKFGGVVGGGVDTVFRLGKGINQWAFGLTPDVNERGKSTTINSGMRFIPIINSAYGKAAVRTFTDWKERQPYGVDRSVTPVGEGKSIWGDEDRAPLDLPTEPSTPESSGFDLAKALTQRK